MKSQLSLTLDCDIVCITETWLSTNYDTSIYNIRGYHCLLNNRTSKRVGGSLLLIRDTLRIIPITKETSSCGAFNVCAVQQPAPAKKILIASENRTPWAFIDEINCLFDELNSLCSINGKKIVMGDFNLPNVDWTLGLGSDFTSIEYQLKSFMCEYDLQQINTSASRDPNILDI